MLKKTLITLVLPLLLLVVVGASLCRGALGSSPTAARRHSAVATDAPTGTVQKMIVENGSVTMDLDLNRLNGISSATQRLQQAHFAVGANSFFPIVVFNDQFRGPTPGSMALIPQNVPALPGALGTSLNQLVIEKLAFRSGIRSCRARQQYGIHVFQHSRATVRLRPGCAVARHHEWPAAGFKRVCRCVRPSIRCRCSRWSDFHRRRNATDRDHPGC